MNALLHPTPSALSLHGRFLSILPRIELHAQIQFRHLQCPGTRDDAIAEVIAVCWRWFLRIEEQGKDVASFVSALADYAVRHVRSGRRLCGQEKSKDVLAPLAQRLRGFTVSKLADFSTLSGNPLSEALTDNTRSPIPDQVAFRFDFPSWLSSLGSRNRRIAEDMALGEATYDLAKRHGISPARISQMRREFHNDWQRFTDDDRDDKGTEVST
jgi:hypothetical protein